MRSHHRKVLLVAAAAMLLASEAGAKPKKVVPPPPPPPPPAPVIVYIPPRPTPPLGASPLFKVPALLPTGGRQTINAGIDPMQTVWNLRSAFNVAALNCQRPEHADILVGYKRFLKIHKLALTKANRAVDTTFRGRYGAAFIRPREAYMTQVYNYYAFPPTLPNFCDAALLMARESMTLKPADLGAFAQRYIPQLDTIYENFYRSYDQYRADAAAWDAKYAPVTVQVAPPLLVPATTAPAATLPTAPATTVAVPKIAPAAPTTTSTTVAAPGR